MWSFLCDTLTADCFLISFSVSFCSSVKIIIIFIINCGEEKIRHLIITFCHIYYFCFTVSLQHKDLLHLCASVLPHILLCTPTIPLLLLCYLSSLFILLISLPRGGGATLSWRPLGFSAPALSCSLEGIRNRRWGLSLSCGGKRIMTRWRGCAPRPRCDIQICCGPRRRSGKCLSGFSYYSPTVGSSAHATQCEDVTGWERRECSATLMIMLTRKTQASLLKH